MDPQEMFRGMFLDTTLKEDDVKRLVLCQLEVAEARGNYQWVRRAAQSAYTLLSEDWVNENLLKRKGKKRKVTRAEETLQPVRDIRLDWEPSLPHVVYHETRTGTQRVPTRCPGDAPLTDPSSPSPPVATASSTAVAKEPTHPKMPPPGRSALRELSVQVRVDNPEHRSVRTYSSEEDSPKRSWKAPQQRPTSSSRTKPGEVESSASTPRPGPSEGPAKKKRKYRLAICGIADCQMETGFKKMHLFEKHVPTIFDEHLNPSRDVCQRRYAALTLMARSMLGREATLGDLMASLNTHQLVSGQQGDISDRQAEAMKQLCISQSWEVPDTFSLSPINSRGALLHWRCLTVLAGCISNDIMTSLRETFKWDDFNPKPAPSHSEETDDPATEYLQFLPVLHGFDSHFHLDRTRKALDLPKEAGLEVLLDKLRPTPPLDYHFQLSGCVAVYCDPESYPEQEELEKLGDAGIQVAIGAHPKTILTNAQMEKLQRYFGRESVVALGEVGLDHSVRNPDDWHRQEEQLHTILKTCLAPTRVLVIHCRGMKRDPTGLYVFMKCLQILQQHVNQAQRIHLHCFTGPEEVVKCWLDALPNTWFGVTGRVTSFNPRQVKGLQAIPRDRLLLETDAPYFPLCPGIPVSAPHLLGFVAEAVATKLQMSMQEVLELTSTNALQLYRTPQ